MKRSSFFALTLSLVLGWGIFAAQQGYAQASLPTPAPLPASERVSTSPQPAPTAGNSADSTPQPASDANSESGNEVSVQLTRKGKDGKSRQIKIVRGGNDDSAYAAICSPQDDEPEDAPSMVIYANRESPGVSMSLDKNVINAPLAVITKKQGGDGHIEVSDGSAKDTESVPEKAKERLERCGVEVKAKTTPDTVLVTQGKTRLKGQKLIYDESDGIARIDGPITFNRDNEKDPLKGRSNRIEVNVDEEKTVLVGNVVLESGGGRISKAGRVEYDDTQNVARLYATPEQPAESVQGSDVVRLTSGYILYHLDNNDVYMVKEASGNLTGEFQDGEKK